MFCPANFCAFIGAGRVVYSDAMNVAESIWNKLTRVVVFLLLLAGLMGIGVWYLPLVRHNVRLRQQLEQLDKQVEQERQSKQEQEGAIQTLRDPRAAERLIRNQLLYAKPGETVIRFEEPITNASPTR